MSLATIAQGKPKTASWADWYARFDGNLRVVIGTLTVYALLGFALHLKYFDQLDTKAHLQLLRFVGPSATKDVRLATFDASNRGASMYVAALLGLTFLACVAYIVQNRPRSAMLLIGAVAGAFALQAIQADLILWGTGPREAEWLTGHQFPSVYFTAAIALYLSLGFLIGRRLAETPRRIVMGISITLAGVTFLSALTADLLSQAVVGCLVALIWLALVQPIATLILAGEDRRRRRLIKRFSPSSVLAQRRPDFAAEQPKLGAPAGNDKPSPLAPLMASLASAKNVVADAPRRRLSMMSVAMEERRVARSERTAVAAEQRRMRRELASAEAEKQRLAREAEEVVRREQADLAAGATAAEKQKAKEAAQAEARERELRKQEVESDRRRAKEAADSERRRAKEIAEAEKQRAKEAAQAEAKEREHRKQEAAARVAAEKQAEKEAAAKAAEEKRQRQAAIKAAEDSRKLREEEEKQAVKDRAKQEAAAAAAEKARQKEEERARAEEAKRIENTRVEAAKQAERESKEQAAAEKRRQEEQAKALAAETAKAKQRVNEAPASSTATKNADLRANSPVDAPTVPAPSGGDAGGGIAMEHVVAADKVAPPQKRGLRLAPFGRKPEPPSEEDLQEVNDRLNKFAQRRRIGEKKDVSPTPPPG